MDAALRDENVSNIRFIAFDTETTGIASSDQLVEIAGQAFDEEFEHRSFQTLVRPTIPIPPIAMGIHGITDAMVAGAPGAPEAAARFLDFLKWAGAPRVLVAHNAAFDIGFFHRLEAGALARSGAERAPELVLDSCMLSRILLPDLPRHGLGALVEHFGIETGRLHRAGADVSALRAVFLKLLGLAADRAARAGGGLTLGALIDLCGGHFVLDPFDADARARPFRFPERIARLEAMCGANTTVAITYENDDDWRHVTPMAIKRRGYRVYVEAFCHRDGMKKTFRADRIVRVGTPRGDEPSC